MAISLDAQLACVRREHALRQRVYPRWVATNKMTQAQADHELATMEAVYRSLLTLQDAQTARVPLAQEADTRAASRKA